MHDQTLIQFRCTALVVDDEEDLREILINMLTSLGLTVQSAPDGKAALEKIKGNHFDLVISDIIMPIMDGINLFEAMRQDQTIHQPRFIFISGGGVTDNQKLEAISTMIDGILTKPCRRNLIIEKLCQLFPDKVLKK